MNLASDILSKERFSTSSVLSDLSTPFSSSSSCESPARVYFCCSHYVRGRNVNLMLARFMEEKCQCTSCYIALLLMKGRLRQSVPLIEKASLSMHQISD